MNGHDKTAAGHSHKVMLICGGTVAATGANGYGHCDVREWAGSVQVAAGGVHTVGLRSDGTAVAVGPEVELAKWNLG